MLRVAPVVVVVLLRASPFPHPGHALTRLFVCVDVVIVDVKVAPAGCAVALRTTCPPEVMVVVEDLPAVVASSVSVVQRVQVLVVPAPVAGCTRPIPRRLGRMEYH